MPLNAKRAFNRPTEIQVDDQVYALYELTANDLVDFEVFANGVLIGQFEAVWNTCAPLTREHLQYMSRVAADRSMKYFEIFSPEVTGIMTTWAGAREMLRMSIRHGRPDWTHAQNAELFGQLDRPIIDRIIHLTGLTDDRITPGSAPDPKAPEPPTPGESGPSTTGEPAAA